MTTRLLRTIVLCFWGAVLASACTSSKPDSMEHADVIIPRPASLDEAGKGFVVKQGAALYAPETMQAGLDVFFAGLQNQTGLSLSQAETPENAAIRLALADSVQGAGAYHLHVGKKGVTLVAATETGLFYGLQTLLQLCPVRPASEKAIRLPGVEVEDAPRFAYRGMHLDVCRHFFGVGEIKKLLDAMAAHKLNRFHWHLTEDQGWRIEIKKYPKLTEIGAWRDSTMLGHSADYPPRYDTTRYGGFYTQEEVREVVQYARERHITVIPEIEMPGHSRAALAAYPELSCTGNTLPVATRWGIFEDIYCAGKEETFEFLQNVLLEVFELFPSEYIHIGGDEAPKTRWKACPACQRRIRTEGLADEAGLQSYFIKRIEKFLHAHGKKLIGWDEILEGGLPARATVMSWRGTEGGKHAAETGHDAIMTPTSHCYFDYYQAESNEPLAIGGYLPLEKVYGFDPVPWSFDAGQAQYILGGQANVWTEYIPDTAHLEYMLFPRLSAMAEALWTPSARQDSASFKSRMAYQYKRYDAWGVNYRIDDPDGFRATNRRLEATAKVTLRTQATGATIRYTTDGSEPTTGSPQYDNGLTLDLSEGPVTLKAASFLPSGKKSRTRTGKFMQMEWKKAFEAENIMPKLMWHYYGRVFPNAMQVRGMPDKTGTTDKILFPDGIKQHHFGMIYEGLLYIPQDSVYTFRLTSDDGAVLQIDDEVMVDNDGHHYQQSSTGKAALREGFHFIEIRYFQAKYGKSLSLEMAAGDSGFGPLPADQLYHIEYPESQLP